MQRLLVTLGAALTLAGCGVEANVPAVFWGASDVFNGHREKSRPTLLTEVVAEVQSLVANSGRAVVFMDRQVDTFSFLSGTIPRVAIAPLVAAAKSSLTVPNVELPSADATAAFFQGLEGQRRNAVVVTNKQPPNDWAVASPASLPSPRPALLLVDLVAVDDAAAFISELSKEPDSAFVYLSLSEPLHHAPSFQEAAAHRRLAPAQLAIPREIRVKPHHVGFLFVIFIFLALALTAICCLMNLDGPASFEDRMVMINKEF